MIYAESYSYMRVPYPCTIPFTIPMYHTHVREAFKKSKPLNGLAIGSQGEKEKEQEQPISAAIPCKCISTRLLLGAPFYVSNDDNLVNDKW